MNPDFLYTNVREVAYEADSVDDKNILFGLTAIMLDSNDSMMNGMDCFVAYVLDNEMAKNLAASSWDVYTDFDKAKADYLLEPIDEKPLEMLHTALKTNAVILIEEERCYLKPNNEYGAKVILEIEQQEMANAMNFTPKNDHFYFSYLPYRAEKYGRTAHNCSEFNIIHKFKA